MPATEPCVQFDVEYIAKEGKALLAQVRREHRGKKLSGVRMSVIAPSRDQLSLSVKFKLADGLTRSNSVAL